MQNIGQHGCLIVNNVSVSGWTTSLTTGRTAPSNGRISADEADLYISN